MNIVLSDPGKGKSYSKKTENPVFVGKKIGETVALDIIGLEGYKGVITGGSDKNGFPMKPTLESRQRKKLFMEKGIGLRQKRKGERRRKRVRGNTVAQDIHQLNLKITEHGSAKLLEALKKTAGEEKAGEAKGEKVGKEGKPEERIGGKAAEKKPTEEKEKVEKKEGKPKEKREPAEEGMGEEKEGAGPKEGKEPAGEKREEEKALLEKEGKNSVEEKEKEKERAEPKEEKAGEEEKEQEKEGSGQTKKE